MGSSYGEFVKYPRTPHLFGSRGTDDDKHMGAADSHRFPADLSLIVEITYLEPPLPVILSRNVRRDRPVPEGVIRALCDKCEPPTLTEAHGLAFVCEGLVDSERQNHTMSGGRT
jgi:hypothetical protein